MAFGDLRESFGRRSRASVEHCCPQPTSREEQGTTTLGGRAIRIEVFNQDPDKQAVVRHTSAGDSMTVFDGHEGWSRMPGQPVRDMDGADLDAARIDADLHFPLHIQQACAELRVEYPERVRDQEAFAISCENLAQPPVKLYFDEHSGLLMRLVHFADSPLGLVPTQTDYDDYRSVDGVETPFRWTIANSEENATISNREDPAECSDRQCQVC